MPPFSHSNSAADTCPPTAWTRIVRARGTVPDETVLAARRTLAQIYDRPLLGFFRHKLRHRPHDAEDWKQDFQLSHLMSGRMFEHASREGRFRSYLFQSVRNYIINRLESEHTRQGTLVTTSLVLDNQFDYDASSEDERLLTRERALACFQQAIELTATWAGQSGDPAKINAARAIRELLITRRPKAGTPERETVDHFKQSVRNAVREEVLLEQGQDDEEIIGREASILMDALRPIGRI